MGVIVVRSITCLVIISFISIGSMHAQCIVASNQSHPQQTMCQSIGIGKALESYTSHVAHSLQFWQEDVGGGFENKKIIASFMQTARIHDELQYSLYHLLLSSFEIAEKYKYDAAARSKNVHKLINDSLLSFISADPGRQNESRTFLTAYQKFLVNGEIVPKEIPFYKTPMGKLAVFAGSVFAGSALLKYNTGHWDGGAREKVQSGARAVVENKVEDLLKTEEGCDKIVELARSSKGSHDSNQLKEFLSDLDNKTLARLSKAYLKSSGGLWWEKRKNSSDEIWGKFKSRFKKKKNVTKCTQTN